MLCIMLTDPLSSLLHFRNGADALTPSYPNDGSQESPYTRLVVKSTGDVVIPKGQLILNKGEIIVNTTSYPPIAGIRTKESTVKADEDVFSAVTKSSFAAIRVSTKYTQAQFKRGFGSDISFDTVDKDSKYQELGVIGFAHNGDGTANADFIIKSWFVH